MNFFDTANMYSNGANEEIVGRALRDFANRDEMSLRQKFIIKCMTVQMVLDFLGRQL
nr:aldo/keto reductase [Alteribacillus bidgolensis]